MSQFCDGGAHLLSLHLSLTYLVENQFIFRGKWATGLADLCHGCQIGTLNLTIIRDHERDVRVERIWPWMTSTWWSKARFNYSHCKFTTILIYSKGIFLLATWRFFQMQTAHFGECGRWWHSSNGHGLSAISWLALQQSAHNAAHLSHPDT